MIASTALLARTTALQSPFRIRTQQTNVVNGIQQAYPAVKEQKLDDEEIIRSSLNGNNLSPFLQEMVDEQRELQMNVGKAMDVLKRDYPDFLRRRPGTICFP